MRLAQAIMASVASDYNVTKLAIGTGFSALSLSLSLLSLQVDSLLRHSAVHDRNNLIVWLLSLSLSHGVVMFASSLVEEEHHYWNWVAAAWLSWLYFSRYVVSIFQMRATAYGYNKI